MTEARTLTLADFLLARIAEDEEIARAADGPAWSGGIERSGEPGHYRGINAHLVVRKPTGLYDPVAPVTEYLRGENVHNVDHAIRHDPARVLAECEAKRGVLALLDIAEQQYQDTRLGAADYADVRRSQITRDALLRAVQMLALPYADHPDYRSEWRP